MLTAEELEARRALLDRSADLQALLDRLLARSRTLVQRDPAIPALKSMLTADGGYCPDDGASLIFDPWSPSLHRCPRCHRELGGERHDRRWVWYQHLWLAERIAEAAATGVLAGDEEVCGWAGRKLEEYGERYLDFPNRDNVLGPSRLFFSTYLESIWLTSILAGGFVLREAGALFEPGIDAVSRVAEEAANLIGEFDEGLSNRQLWHNAALAGTAAWFGDEDLATRAIEGRGGLVGDLVDGFGDDGAWHEGDNYHLFALRGMLLGAAWARLAGVDFFSQPASRARLVAALRAPALTALPDGTFPARKDSRFGVSLAQPMYLESWEAGVGALAQIGEDPGDLTVWLRQLYEMPAPAAETFDSWLHEAGERTPARRGRQDLSWWMLFAMAPELPGEEQPWEPASTLLESQGLAVLRGPGRYASLECGLYGGGHGHPDRLHLTLHTDGVHWLADPGTGSYVSPDLFWYRSTLAHNAPLVDGRSQSPGDARCETFDSRDGWGWVRGAFGGLTRTVVAGPHHLLDILEFAADEEHQVELPWHLAGAPELLSPGKWQPAEFTADFVADAERLLPGSPGLLHWRATAGEGAPTLDLFFDGVGEVLRATAPGRPNQATRRPFLLRRHRGRYVRLVSVLSWSGPAITGVRFAPAEVVVETADGPVVHRQVTEGWEVQDGRVSTLLKGQRRGPLAVQLDVPVPGREILRYVPPSATAWHLPDPPPLDGSLDGFVLDHPLQLDHDDQYRRSEDPYPGAELLAAVAYLGWDERRLFLAVEVTDPDPVFPRPDAPPLLLDNEPDLIHASGIELFVTPPGGPALGWLAVPDPTGNRLQVRPLSGTTARAEQVTGGWQRTERGYRITLGAEIPGWPPGPGAGDVRCDLLVNEMRSDRMRRAGQLVWTGGGGWVYLRGDRQDAGRFGTVVLA